MSTPSPSSMKRSPLYSVNPLTCTSPISRLRKGPGNAAFAPNSADGALVPTLLLALTV